MTNVSNHIGVYSSAFGGWTQATGAETFDHSQDAHGNHAGEDVPWILKYVLANKVEALLCTLFSLAVGLCFILLAVLCCICCRWKQAKSRGTFAVAKSNNEGAGRVSGYAPGGTKESEGLLNSGTVHSSSGGRTYSSPRLIRAEYARGTNTSGGNTPSSTSNANVVGLYLSQVPKSRWSRASDATVWPLPPSTLAGNPMDGEAYASNAAARTLPINEQPSKMTSTRTTAMNSTIYPLLCQNNNTLPPHFQIQSSFSHASSPTDYLFNRQSIPAVSRLSTNTPCNIASPQDTNSTNSDMLRKNPQDENVAQRKALSYQEESGMSISSHQNQHHSYLGPCHHPTSPPILPAPASSPWPARNSQIMLDDLPTTSTASNRN